MCSYSPSPNSARAMRLRMPLFGAARISQAIAPRKGGVTNDAVTRARISRRSGRSVRATSQASGSDAAAGPQRDAEGDFDGRQIRRREARIGRQTHEIGGGQGSVVIGDAVPDEPSERQQDQAAQKQREQDHDRARQIEMPRRPLPGARQCDRHRSAGKASPGGRKRVGVGDGTRAGKAPPGRNLSWS